MLERGTAVRTAAVDPAAASIPNPKSRNYSIALRQQAVTMAMDGHSNCSVARTLSIISSHSTALHGCSASGEVRGAFRSS